MPREPQPIAEFGGIYLLRHSNTKTKAAILEFSCTVMQNDHTG